MTASFSVKLNGALSRRFLPSRGLRQGDPLSPYLFLFCVEGFSALLKHAQEEKRIKGVSFGSTGPTVTHLLFANDSIVFPEGSQDNFHCLRAILQDCEVASRQKVNLEKSSIFFGRGCQNDVKDQLKTDIGIQSEALSERYLGLPTAVGRITSGTFEHIGERSRSKMQGWSERLFACAGR